MPIHLPEASQNNLEADSTRPINLVRWEHAGFLELLSCSGEDITLNGEIYVSGGVNISSIKDGRTATLTEPSNPTRTAQVQNDTWRNGICQIYAIPAVPGNGTTYTSAEAVMQLDGLIDTSKDARGKITVAVVHRFSTGFTPRNTIDEIADYLPAPGTILIWEDTELVLEARR